MKLEDKIKADRRCRRYEKLLRKIRIRIFDYEDESLEKYNKAQRVIKKCKAKCKNTWDRDAEARKNLRADRIMHLWT